MLERRRHLRVIVEEGHVGDRVDAEGAVYVAGRHAMLPRKHAQVQHIDLFSLQPATPLAAFKQ